MDNNALSVPIDELVEKYRGVTMADVVRTRGDLAFKLLEAEKQLRELTVVETYRAMTTTQQSLQRMLQEDMSILRNKADSNTFIALNNGDSLWDGRLDGRDYNFKFFRSVDDALSFMEVQTEDVMRRTLISQLW